MLLYSMAVSLDGFVADRDGRIDFSVPDDALFAFHTERVRELGAFLIGRRLYETMSVWETDPAFRATEAYAAFADVWTALPKVVFSRSAPTLVGNARVATRSLADEVAAAQRSSDLDVEIGGAELGRQAVELDLVDELRIFRCPVVLGGGTPFLPPVATKLAFTLLESRAYGSGVLYECFRRDRDGSAA